MSKFCEYCEKEGEAYTFLSGETICHDCLMSMPTTPYGLRMDLYRLRAELEDFKKIAQSYKENLVLCNEMASEVERLTALVHEHQTYTPKQSIKDPINGA